ncbi:putative reverse transcriptase domain-containing protein [Tanacetum coccineum]
MVNTRTDAELAAAVQAAVDAMLPQIREQVREEYRTGAVASGSNPPPVTIHTWLERFNKQKPRSFEKAVAPVDAENWISHMEKIFDVMDCNDAFKTRLAVYKFEGDALAWWKAYKQAKGGDAWVLTLTWAAFKELFFLQFFPRAEQERLKREYHSIRQRASENSTEYMQRFLRLAGFLGQAAGTAEEQAKNFRWGLHKSILDHVMCIQFTDVAQVADAARNLEILRDRDDYDRSERSDKRHKSGDRYQSDTQQNNYRSHDQKNDRQGSDRQGGGGNYRNNNNNNYSRDNNRSNLNRYRLYLLYDMNLTSRHGNRNSGVGRDQRNRGSQQSRVPSEGYTHPVCNTCGRRHPGECRRAAGTCFKCGQAGHLQRDCKKNIGASSSGHADKKPDASGRVFALTQDQAANTSGTITGALFIFGRAVFVLFDTGATHSVISTKFASCFTMTPILLDHVLCISTPMKDSARITHVYRDLPLQFDDKIRSVNALPLDMCEFDIILGIDWLAAHRATIDCHSRRVIFGDIHAPEFIYHGSLPGKSMKIISALKARTLLSHGCEGFLATIHDTTSDVSSIHDQPIVSEFQDVFPEELPGIPPIRDVEFNIELIPGAEPISKAPYRMAPIELKELKDQLQELLERGFIRPSVSPWGPWGAPILFSQKKRRSEVLTEKSGQVIQNILISRPSSVDDDGIYGRYQREIGLERVVLGSDPLASFLFNRRHFDVLYYLDTCSSSAFAIPVDPTVAATTSTRTAATTGLATDGQRETARGRFTGGERFKILKLEVQTGVEGGRSRDGIRLREQVSSLSERSLFFNRGCFCLRVSFQDFKERMEVQQEQQAQELYNRVAELEAHVMDDLRPHERGILPTHLLTPWPEEESCLGRAVDFGMQEGLEAGHEHGIDGRSLSAVDAYNPETAKARYFDAVKAIEDVDFPLVSLLKSKKDAGMDEVLDSFLLDGPLALLPKRLSTAMHRVALRSYSPCW